MIEKIPEIDQSPMPKDLIVEIGPGLLPLTSVSENILERIKTGSSYVAIDCDEEKFRINGKIRTLEGGPIVIGDLANLPLQNGVAS